MAKQKFYAVRIGKNPGVYTTWSECLEQIKGFKGNIYRAFLNEEDAKEFIKIEDTTEYEGEINIFVDGSFNESTNFSGYSAIIVKDDKMIDSKYGKIYDEEGRKNILGEIKAAITAMELAILNKYDSITINYDYKGIEHYAKGDWECRNEMLKNYKLLYEKLIKENKCKIKFRYCKSHIGIKWNEKADELAKTGCGIV